MQVTIEVGSRGESRQWQSSPVPVDIITASELTNTGFTDLNKILLHLLPDFNFQQLAIRDGSDHSRPFALRGMSADQVLVLVNGKQSSNAGGFFRRSLDNRTLRSRYPDGFLPRISPKIKDFSITMGISDTTTYGWTYDINNTLGNNSFHYFVDNSVNVSLGNDSPSHFDSGKLIFTQDTLNVDWTNGTDLSNTLAFGLEYRFERYQIIAGETASWVHGGVPVLDGPNQGAITQADAQVFPGFRPTNETDVDHNSYAAYADWTRQLTPKWLTQAAARLEYHSDFGSNFDYKLASRYQFTDRWHLRGSLSTGFRAP